VSRAAFRERFDVSCETLDRLDVYVGLLRKWSRAINLLGPTEIDEIWRRHLFDSAQLIDYLPNGATSWLDLGAGAGFPGMVCAVLLCQADPRLYVELVESDQRKAAFLRESARQMQVDVRVHAIRSEDLAPRAVDVVTARAFAPLSRLLRHAAPFASVTTTLLLHKGRTVRNELTEARKDWHMDVEILPSLSDPAGAILRLTRLRSIA